MLSKQRSSCSVDELVVTVDYHVLRRLTKFLASLLTEKRQERKTAIVPTPSGTR